MARFADKICGRRQTSVFRHSKNLLAGIIAEIPTEPNVRQIVRVRYLDDAGKIAGMVTPGFAYYAPMVQRVVDAHCTRRADT